MITKTDTLTWNISSSIGQHPNLKESVIFDIETTGLSPKNSFVYLIGVLFQNDKKWQLTQWLAESQKDEAALFTAFFCFLKNFRFLIHFNGDAFDLPFLTKRCAVYHLPAVPESLTSIDLYQRLRPLKKFLKLSSMNLKSLEDFLNLSRQDTMSGGELISVYHQFETTKDDNLKRLLLLHNHDDLSGTAALFPLFSYLELLNGRFELSHAETISGQGNSFELLLRLSLSTPVPRQISVPLESGYLTACGSTCSLSVHGIYGTMKYFFQDYRNYYYLPLEDTAIHKSVASYVDKAHRVPAKASTCYCKRTGRFLPGIAGSAMPVFRQDYRASAFYQECTEEFLSNSSSLLAYVRDLLYSYF